MTESPAPAPRIILVAISLLAVCLSAPPPTALGSGGDRPNIIFFWADDLGPDGVGAYGSFEYEAVELPPGEDPATWTDAWGRSARPSRTPAIDRLADEGLRFTRAYATGICSPSRAQFATGQYPFRNGVIDIDGSNYRSDPNKPSLAELMKNAGYVTGECGKADIDRENPDERITGWQYYKADARPFQLPLTIFGPGSIPSESDYMPDNDLAFALDFIERNAPTAPDDPPFYFLYGYHLPHAPIHPTPDSLEFNGGAPPGETDAERTKRQYGDMIAYLDKTIQTVIDRLDALGQLDNTILIFSGDNGSLRAINGATLQGPILDPASGTYRELDGSKADRANNREGTALVPFVIRWPDAIGAGRQGTTTDELIDYSDILPTFAAIAGIDVPDNWDIDGRSILPLIEGGTYTARPWVFTQIQNNWALRGADYRLNRDGRFFDMSDAPFSATELTSLTPAQQAIRDDYQAVLDEFDPANGPTYEAHQDKIWNNPAWTWKDSNFNSTQRWETPFSGDRADPDGDEVLNSFERLWGWNPNDGSDVMPKVTVPGGDTLAVTVPALTGNDTRLVVETTEDLMTWTPLDPQPGGPPHEFRKPGLSDKEFMRLRTERITPWDEP